MKKIYLIYLLVIHIIYKVFSTPEWIVFDTSNSDLPDNNIFTVAIDYDGNKWFGTLYNGYSETYIIKFDNRNWEIYPISDFGLPANNSINVITFNDLGDALIGTEHGGIIKLSGANWIVYNDTNSGLPVNTIDDISIDDSGNIWICSSNGLTKFDGNDEWFTYNSSNSGMPSNNGIRDVLIDFTGNKWIGTDYGGLVKFNDTLWTIFNSSNSGLEDDDVRSIALDKGNNKWIGTSNTNKLVKFDDEEWSFYSLPDTLYGWHIYTIAIDSTDNKWLTYGLMQVGINDLLKFDGTEWTVYNDQDSVLAGRHVSNIAVDRYNNKWFGTDSGVVVYRKGGVVNTIHNPQFIQPNKLTFIHNYPNPFRLNTTIKFILPKSFHVKLSVFDMSGREVAVLIDRYKHSGEHRVSFSASNLANGLYFYRLRSGDLVRTGKMVVAR